MTRVATHPPLMVALENIRSVYNVGSVFRTCDSAGVDHLFLTGYTATPPHPKLKKTALGSTTSVAWTHLCDAGDLVRMLKNDSVRVVAMEPVENAGSLFDAAFDEPTCLFFGNEETGLSQMLLHEADEILRVPMLGMKESLNVAVAAGVAMYEFRRKTL